MKAGDLRKVKTGTVIWSIALQESVIVQRELIVEITNTIYNNKEDAFVKSKLTFGMMPGMIPGLSDKHNGEYGPINIINDTDPYELPDMSLNMNYQI